MHHPIKSVTSVSMLGALMACAQVQAPAPQAQRAQSTRQAAGAAAMPVTVAAVPPAPQEASPVEQAYAAGRAAHSAGQLVEAARHYEQVLQQAPEHIGALNAVGVIHAQAGRTELALAMFDRALALAPEAAHVHNNAGYALLQAGRLDEADTRLRRAQALNPDSAQTRQNRDLLAKARLKAAPASTPIPPAAPAADDHTGPRLVGLAPHLYELRLPSARQVPPQAATAVTVAPPPSAMPSLRGVRLEVANGAGITRLARRTALRLTPTGVIPARLTNARPYRQKTTEIQYAFGHGDAALALQARLPVSASVVSAAGLAPGVQLRLVLGRDMARQSATAWLGEHRAPLTAQLAQPGGWMWG